jgi:alpha-1,2-mannosyltransferase
VLSARTRSLWPYLLVGVVAFAVRAGLVLRSAGPLGSYGYDSGVYYAAADSLLHGRIPYRDFVLLHPPGIMLALTPSALLGHLTTDRLGFLSGNVLFAALGSANAALTVIVARRWGLSLGAAIAGGLFYALWIGAAGAEYLSRLEPLGNFFLLLALWALAGSGLSKESGQVSSRALLWAGAALTLAASTKIWFGVPLAVIVIWVAVRRGRPAVKPLVSGILLTGLLVDGPFLALSRGAMFSRVVVDQLGRRRQHLSFSGRLGELTSATRLPWATGHTGVFTATVIVVALGAISVLLAVRTPATRLFALLAAAHVLVLVLSPSWFAFYADFATVPIALCIAAAAGSVRMPQRAAAWATTAIGGVATAAIAITGTFHATSSWHHAAALASAVRPLRCVMSDAPSGLIELNKLDSDLSHGCPNWVDVTGRTYFGADKAPVSRAKNSRWQRDLARYLLSGDAVFIVRASGDGLTAATRAAIERGGVLAHRGVMRVYSTGAGAARGADRR